MSTIAQRKMKKWSAKKRAAREKRYNLASFIMKAADEGGREGAMIPREKLYEIHDALMKH